MARKLMGLILNVEGRKNITKFACI